MRSQEQKISPLSDYYIYAPSTLAQKLYLYPLSTGYFMYEPGYFISRKNFNSFLLMYIAKGSCRIETDSFCGTASAGQFVLLDCYQPHRYGHSKAWNAAWLHFDGPLARDYFTEITSHYGCILNPDNPKSLILLMDKICDFFRTSAPISEPVISGHITNILNRLLYPAAEFQSTNKGSAAISDSVSYINEHFQESISVEQLAKKANLSLYHFVRIFSKEIGFTPHQYLLNTRICAAKFMLKSSEMSIKDITFSTGFKSESSFCSAFKKWEGVTPSEYRQHVTVIRN